MNTMAPVASSSTLDSNYLLSDPREDESLPVFERPASSRALISKYNNDFLLKNTEKSYEQQYASLYFLRLTVLKPRVSTIAAEAWNGMSILNQRVKAVDRVLDVRQGELCWIVGTVYMEMTLKPNILDEITKEFWTTAPISKDKFADPENDAIMLEDESGRVNLVGSTIKSELLVTGCVVAVLGSETTSGDFDVIDIRYPQLAPQLPRPVSTGHERKCVALVSGLEVSGDVHESYETSMLIEYLMGELGGSDDSKRASEIIHVIVAGNSFANNRPSPLSRDEENGDSSQKKKKKYGYDSSSYNSKPTEALDSMLGDLSNSVCVDIMPGDQDPTNYSFPQQPINPAMVPRTRRFLGSGFRSVSNPCWWDVEGLRILGTGGQPIDDIFKYVEGDDRLKMMEYSLRWQHCAPTAPDTLWSYPFRDCDPFILHETPHLFFAGNQPEFKTKIIEGDDGQRVRLLALPKFSETGQLVLVDVDSLACEVVTFAAGATALD
ncbi:DNA polymerase alpha/epsilon subunit B-domain-containing protein [Lipomyces orientalis]|uniref:DNA polymerase alpha/epsilon subunit B-domain-containing protein n=1 Tax=Lipomyces orientalis TaxID=1233043 RepID=A0ACC3TET9_9ASCO